MKQLGKLKLSHLSKNALDEKQQNVLRGGVISCPCGCSGCGCPGWDGTGPMPNDSDWSDHGNGSVSANLSGTLAHGI